MSEKKFTPRYIPASEVPQLRAKWQEIFAAIPEGKALVIEDSKAHYGAVRTSLHRFQETKGLFKNYSVVSRQKQVYVIHAKGVSGEESKK